MANTPTLKLANAGNAPIPGIGLGCWSGRTKAEQATSKDWVLTALKAGYRLLDTAYGYGTEKYVGQAIKESGIPREEIFIITKLPNHHHRRVQESIDQSLKNLGTDYVDLWLMHFPQATTYKVNDDGESEEDATVDDGATFPEVWAEMEKVLAAGKTKAIGVSNFSIKTLSKLLETAKVVPALNEVEMHPLLAQEGLVEWSNAKGILTCAYTPSGYDTVRNDPTIVDLAKAYGVTSTQIILAWHVQRGIIPIPKSANEKRQKENLDLPKLSNEDFARVSAMDKDQRLCNAIGSDGKCWGWTAEQYGW